MKRLLILLTLITLMLAVGVFAECTDTDDGKEYATKGTTTYTKEGKVIAENVDLCKDEGTLLEYFCDPTGKTSSEYKICACVDGACTDITKPVEEVKEETPEEVPEEEPTEIPPEEAPETQPEITPVKAKPYTWIAIVAVLVIIGVAVAMFLKRKKELKVEVKGVKKK